MRLLICMSLFFTADVRRGTGARASLISPSLIAYRVSILHVKALLTHLSLLLATVAIDNVRGGSNNIYHHFGLVFRSRGSV